MLPGLGSCNPHQGRPGPGPNPAPITLGGSSVADATVELAPPLSPSAAPDEYPAPIGCRASRCIARCPPVAWVLGPATPPGPIARRRTPQILRAQRISSNNPTRRLNRLLLSPPSAYRRRPRRPWPSCWTGPRWGSSASWSLFLQSRRPIRLVWDPVCFPVYFPMRQRPTTSRGVVVFLEGR